MKKQILFVDDEHRILTGLERMLHGKRDVWDVTFACGVDEAQKALEMKKIDVAVLDINMPGKTGLELLSEIKNNTETKNIEVIILTGMLDGDLKYKALELGAADLLNKPVQKEDLLARLRSVLKIKAYHDELVEHNVLLEQQLIQSQKMELIGHLSAGVVHDLKNILMGISGYSELIVFSLDGNSQAKDDLIQIRKSTQRATDIIQQIHRFSQQGVKVEKECSLGLIIDECVNLLKHSFSKDISIDWHTSETIWLLEAESIQIYQVVMNLCVNAAQSMADGGRLQIRLSEVNLEEESGSKKQISASGHHVMLEVSDTGIGMDPETLEKIYNLSFSTKQSQGGSGLGLSIVQRIVRNHKGFIKVKSQPGCGTTFSVFFPLSGIN
ncbi:response regulator [bacterium]|nr:response regulator [bacterium]